MILKRVCVVVVLFSVLVIFQPVSAGLAADAEDRDASDRLQAVEQELTRLAEEESALRDQWMVRHRATMDAQRRLLREDEEVRLAQERINQAMQEVRRLQEELEALITERSQVEAPDPEMSQESLQQEIMRLRGQRQELIQERTRLLRLQTTPPATEAAERSAAPDHDSSPQEDNE